MTANEDKSTERRETRAQSRILVMTPPKAGTALCLAVKMAGPIMVNGTV